MRAVGHASAAHDDLLHCNIGYDGTSPCAAHHFQLEEQVLRSGITTWARLYLDVVLLTPALMENS